MPKDQNMPTPTMPPMPTEPMDEQAMVGVMEKTDAAKRELVGQGAPEPNKPYKVKTLEYLRDTINQFAEAFPGMPMVKWEYAAPEGKVIGMGAFEGPVPPDLWGPLEGLAAAIETANTDGSLDAYVVDLQSATDDTSLRTIINTLATALKDEAFMEAMRAGPGGAQAGMEKEDMEEPTEEPTDEAEGEDIEDYVSRAMPTMPAMPNMRGKK